MSVVEMNKLSLLGLNCDKEDILKGLMELGAVHIEDIVHKLSENAGKSSGIDPEELTALEGKIEKLSVVLKHLGLYDKRKKTLFAVKRLVSRESFVLVQTQQQQLWQAVEEILSSEQHMAHLRSEKNRYANLMASLDSWKTMEIPLDMTGTENTAVLMGYVSGKGNIEPLEKELEKIGLCFMQVLSREREHTYIYLIYHVSAAEEAGKVLKQHSFTKVAFEDMSGTADENICQTLKRIQEVEKEFKVISEKMAVYADKMEELELLYDSLVIQRDRKKALMQLAGSENVFVLEGWIPAYIGDGLSERLQNKWTCAVSVRKPAEDEEYPVLLKNGAMGRSVEAITAMYSVPHPREVDPNSIMSLFFVFFYGLMMGDGVYGAAIILAAGFALWKIKLEESARRFVKLMLYCGFSTVFWGALFGGWMGIPYLSKYYLWMNPVERPEEFLGWSLLFGVLHIYVSMGVKGVNLFRQKKYVDIIWDVAVFYVFFTGFILFILPYVFTGTTEFNGLVDTGKYMFLGSAFVIVVTQGRKNKNIFLKFISGAAKLYDIIKFTSDVLSYSRLMALGLATSVIGFIVYEIAIMNGTDSLWKVIVFVLILLAGHLLNFAIAMLSAFVHSSRLQYIESFSRFYKGGGVPFNPLRTNTKFIRIKEEKDCEYIIFGNDR